VAFQFCRAVKHDFSGFPQSHSQSQDHSITFSVRCHKSPFPRFRQGLWYGPEVHHIRFSTVHGNVVLPVFRFGEVVWHLNIIHVFRIPMMPLIISSNFWSNMQFASPGLKMEAACYSGILDLHTRLHGVTT
jgi:hypothetical protein